MNIWASQNEGGFQYIEETIYKDEFIEIISRLCDLITIHYILKHNSKILARYGLGFTLDLYIYSELNVPIKFEYLQKFDEVVREHLKNSNFK